ncbi:ATP-dependent Clp protease proteolytic subunit [Escherichia coli J96]|nr:ATP-dependent Clp protease proteolytic subunit [Escherichia coli J96]EOR53694.1 ATP-dependent Clp protease proteolytic subunit [Escherichia coli ATCC 25922]
MKYGDAVPITQGLADNPSIRLQSVQQVFSILSRRRKCHTAANEITLHPIWRWCRWSLNRPHEVSALLISILVYLRNASFF